MSQQGSVRGKVASLISALGNCARRWREPEEEDEDLPHAPLRPSAPADAAVADEASLLPRGFELATSLKDDGNVAFQRGDLDEAIEIWSRALDALHTRPPPEAQKSAAPRAEQDSVPEGASAATAAALQDPTAQAQAVAEVASRAGARSAVALDGLFQAANAVKERSERPPEPQEDPRVVELRGSLFSNLALVNMKRKQWRQALGLCEEALFDQPKNQKALYRKADCLAELGAWPEAEETLVKMEALGEDAAKLAAQKREAWKKKSKAEDDKQKKMWSAALAKQQKGKGAADEKESRDAAAANGTTNDKPSGSQIWSAPRVAPSSVFDLRRKDISWVENEDFDDKVWRDGLGVRPVDTYYKQAMPLSLIAGIALADLELESEITLHVIIDGNSVPFREPHPWGLFLKRCPNVKSLMVVYIDIGKVPANEPPGSMPYGTLLRPVEEARSGDRVVYNARFLGTYKEFRDHCRDLPGIVKPRLSIWADTPIYGLGDDEFAGRLEALSMIAQHDVPIIVLQESEIPEKNGPLGGPWLGTTAKLSMAILEFALGAKSVIGWHWNRFVIPLDQTEKGILAAHAVLGVLRPAKETKVPSVAALKKVLQDHSVEVAPCVRVKGLGPPTKADKAAWAAFQEQMRRSGRPTGPNVPDEERQRQMLEFRHFCEATRGARPK